MFAHVSSPEAGVLAVAQGNALGIGFKERQALKGRSKVG